MCISTYKANKFKLIKKATSIEYNNKIKVEGMIMCNSCKSCEFDDKKSNTMFYYCELGEMTCKNGICENHLEKGFLNKIAKPMLRFVYKKRRK